MKEAKLIERLHACLKEMYENSEPKANWDDLKDRRDDYFLEYRIDPELAYNIVEKHSKYLRKHDRDRLTFSIWLGPSPKFE
jgi:hypothetical protein